MVKEQEQKQKAHQPQETKSQEPPKEPSLFKFATLWALSFVSKNANEALERLKAQFEEAKKEKQRERQIEQTAEQRTAKVMQNLAAKKQAQKAEIDAIEQKIKARNERGRSRRQSIEDAKMRIASRQVEREKEIKQKQEQERREVYRRQYGHDPEPPKPPTPPRKRGRSR